MSSFIYRILHYQSLFCPEGEHRPLMKLRMKVHKNDNFFGSDFEISTFSLLIMLKYQVFVKQILIVPLFGEVRFYKKKF